MPSACAVALVLLLDASGSMTAEDWRMQVQGTADGIADEAVTRIIERQGAVAMTAIAFSDMTVPMVPWRIVSTAAEAQGFAQSLREAPRALYGGTRIGEAITDGVLALDSAPCGGGAGGHRRGVRWRCRPGADDPRARCGRGAGRAGERHRHRPPAAWQPGGLAARQCGHDGRLLARCPRLERLRPGHAAQAADGAGVALAPPARQGHQAGGFAPHSTVMSGVLKDPA